MLFERWLDEALTGITLPGHRQHLERFASWHIRLRLRRFADRGPVTGKQTGQARDEVRLAIAFQAWLHDRGRELADCRRPTSTPGTPAATPPAGSPRLPALGREQQAHAPGDRPAPGHREPGTDQPTAARGPAPSLLTGEETDLLTRVPRS